MGGTLSHAVSRHAKIATKRLLIVGGGRVGKDEALLYLEAITGLKSAGCTSIYLAKYVAADLGISEEEAYAKRHANRDIQYRIGNAIRDKDPGILLREALQFGDMTGGVRDAEEIVVARAENMFDRIVWIENTRVPPDPTLKFGKEMADLVIENNGRMRDYYAKLYQFAVDEGLV